MTTQSPKSTLTKFIAVWLESEEPSLNAKALMECLLDSKFKTTSIPFPPLRIMPMRTLLEPKSMPTTALPKTFPDSKRTTRINAKDILDLRAPHKRGLDQDD